MWVSHIQMPPTKNHRTFDLNDYSRSAGGNHEHRAISSNGLIVDVDAYDGIGSKSLSTLHHLLHRCVFCLGKYLLVTACTASYDVADACKEVFEHVGTNNGFTCHNTLILADGVTFNLWGC